MSKQKLQHIDDKSNYLVIFFSPTPVLLYSNLKGTFCLAADLKH